MIPQRALIAVEAMSNVDRMAMVAAEYGTQLVLLAEDPDYYGIVHNTIVVPFPTRDSHALRLFVEEYRAQIVQVFSVTDTWGVIASQLRDDFAFPQFLQTSHLQNLRSKKYVQARLIKEGLAQEPTGWPRVIKASAGTGKINVYHVRSDDERRALELPSKHYVEQSYYRGPLYSAEVWRDEHTFRLFGITNRILSDPPDFTERVKSFPWCPDTQWESEVEEWAAQVLEVLDFTYGQAHLEFIESRHGFELVEINCRMAGALITPSIVATTNFDPYRLAVEQALGVDCCLPARREITGGYSHVSLYAQHTGVIGSISGTCELNAYPGEIEWHPVRGCGAQIAEVGTYRSRIGNVVAHGPTAQLAQDRALSAAAAIKIVIDSRGADVAHD